MEDLVKKIQKQFNTMCKTGKLFRANVSGELLWETYLKGFKNDPVFRSTESSVHNCNYCHSFIKRYGNIVALDDNQNIINMFDLKGVDEEYNNSMKAMSILLKKSSIKDIFVETFDYLNNIRTPYGETPFMPLITRNLVKYYLGVKQNSKTYFKEDIDRWPNSGIKLNQTVTFHHMYVTIPKEFIDFSGNSAESICASYRQIKEVFKRGLDEISLDTLNLIRDLEAQGSLLNGESYKHIIVKAIKYAEEYKHIPEDSKDSWCWIKSLEWGPQSAFRNTAIGTLMVDLSEGMEINEACKAFNYKVDPTNYMKATAPITKKQIEEAQKFVEENGYSESFNRRCATIEDIKVCDILYTNQDANLVKTKVSLFDDIKPTAHTQHKKAEFKNVEEVSIDKFMSDILPGCSQVELYLENRFNKNFVSLLTSDNKESKSIFKWNNNFSWTYNGNLAGKSQIKQAVKSAGGFVNAPFRFSIMWNEDGRSIVDFDAHCTERTASYHDEIYYGSHNINKQMNAVQTCKSYCGGVIDIDMIRPNGVGVENIFYPNLDSLQDGTYTMYVRNYDGGHNTGIKAEIVFKNNIYNFVVNHEIKQYITFATIHIKNSELESIDLNKEYLTDSTETKDNVWGLDTLEFHKVSLVCLSPNYWGETGVGNKHYFFMLENAIAPDDIRTFHNEFLNPELLKHRKVMEVLGAKLRCKSTKKQLSGIGFNATVHDEVLLRLSGTHKRVIKVKF